MKKKLVLLIGAILVFIFAVVALGIGLGNKSDPDIEGNFEDNQIIIVLTHKESINKLFHDYTIKDFYGIGAIAVDELSVYSTEWLREKELGITDRETLINLDEYRRAFCITLKKHSKANVIKMAKKLSKRKAIEIAEPNYIMSID